MITDIGKVIEEHVEINEKNHGTLVVKQKECIHKLKNECGDVKIEFPNLGAGDRVVISDSKADVALSKQRLSDHAKVLVCIIQYKCTCIKLTCLYFIEIVLRLYLHNCSYFSLQ